MVTGANGQLATTLRKYASQWPNYDWVFCDHAQLPIEDFEQVSSLFKELQPSFCINTAAYTRVEDAEKFPKKANLINGVSVKHLAACCNQFNTTLLHLSTDYVFDGKQAHPYLEHSTPNPINAYGKSKRMGEKAVLDECVKGYVIRTSWLYAKSHGKNFYRSILQKAQKGQTIEVVNDQVGTPTSTQTVAQGIVRLINSNAPYGIYHLADTTVCSWYDFAKKILEEHQLQAPLIPIQTPIGGAPRPPFSALGTQKKDLLCT